MKEQNLLSEIAKYRCAKCGKEISRAVDNLDRVTEEKCPDCIPVVIMYQTNIPSITMEL